MKLSFELNEFTIVYGDVHNVDGHLEVSNIAIEIYPENGGLSMWGKPSDDFTQSVFVDELIAKYREEQDARAS